MSSSRVLTINLATKISNKTEFQYVAASDFEIPSIIDLGRSVTEADVSYYLYTRQIDGALLSADDLIKTIDASLPTVFIIHGWTSSGNASFMVDMARAYVQRRESNAVAVDWSGVAAKDFLSSAGSVDDVGESPKTALKRYYMFTYLQNEQTS